jgi:hypothetical protein
MIVSDRDDRLSIELSQDDAGDWDGSCTGANQPCNYYVVRSGDGTRFAAGEMGEAIAAARNHVDNHHL